jgi:DNA-binding XRE family transcriptional regulator
MAYLLGCKGERMISYYENQEYLPSLKVALMYEALFGVPVAELFAGVYQQIEKEIAKRARVLMRKLESTTSTRKNSRKADLLRAVAITPEIKKEHP